MNIKALKTISKKIEKILENEIGKRFPIMQRGVGNVNPMKMARCIQELERIKGNQYVPNPNYSDLPTQAESTIASY